jgi:hypothetical protein
MQGDDTRRARAAPLSDRTLWQRSRATDAADDDAERILDLAGFADGALDPDDQERVADWLQRDPLVAGDIVAARALGAQAERLEPAPEPVVARACALVKNMAPRATVVPFPAVRDARPMLRRMASWGSLAAAMAVASWLGFTLGMDTSLSVTRGGQTGEDGFLSEMLDPSTGFIRDLTEGNRT